jgi:hypothetical protein
MSIAIGLLLIAVAAAFVAVPFFRTAAPAEPSRSLGHGLARRRRLERQKLEAYAAIKELEFDYRMGKLSDTDFAAIRDKYAAQALEAIAALEAPAATVPRPLGTSRRPTRVAFCPNCGHAALPRANFCSACGRALKEAVA